MINRARFLLERENKKFYLCHKHMMQENEVPGTITRALPEDADIECQYCTTDRMNS